MFTYYCIAYTHNKTESKKIKCYFREIYSFKKSLCFEGKTYFACVFYTHKDRKRSKMIMCPHFDYFVMECNVFLHFKNGILLFFVQPFFDQKGHWTNYPAEACPFYGLESFTLLISTFWSKFRRSFCQLYSWEDVDDHVDIMTIFILFFHMDFRRGNPHPAWLQLSILIDYASDKR